MVTGISSSNYFQYQSEMQINTSLTDDEKNSVEDIVAKYDSSSISESDFATMMDEINELGIAPSKDIIEILDEAGFEKPEGVEPPPGPPRGEKTEIPDFLTELLQQKDEGTLSQEDFDSIMQNLQSSYEQDNGNLIDKSV